MNREVVSHEKSSRSVAPKSHVVRGRRTWLRRGSAVNQYDTGAAQRSRPSQVRQPLRRALPLEHPLRRFPIVHDAPRHPALRAPLRPARRRAQPQGVARDACKGREAWDGGRLGFEQELDAALVEAVELGVLNGEE